MGQSTSQSQYTLPPLESHYPHPGWPNLICDAYRGDVSGSHLKTLHEYVIQHGAQSEQFFYNLVTEQQKQIDALKKQYEDAKITGWSEIIQLRHEIVTLRHQIEQMQANTT